MADPTGLSFLDKIKLLMGLKSLVAQVPTAVPGTTSIWSKLDGTKSITGLLMIIAYYVGPQFHVQVPDIFLKIGIAWAGVGFLHKFDKTTNVLTAVMTALIKTNDKLNENSTPINGDKK